MDLIAIQEVLGQAWIDTALHDRGCVSSDYRTRTHHGRARGGRHERKVDYAWRLREVMAQHQIFTAIELMPLLRERGIDLSASQIHRLVSGTPERLSPQVLSALCPDLLDPDAGGLP
jgi:hypothetical protein